MKRIDLIILIIFCSLFCNKKITAQAFSKEYSILSYSKFRDYGFIIPTFEKGYLMTFASNSGANVLKVDSAGTVLWSKKYNGTTKAWFGDGLIVQAPDSGFVIPGFNYDPGFKWSLISLLKVDKFGVPQWTKSYGDTALIGTGYLTSKTNNGFVLAGYCWDTISKSYKMQLLKTDFSGNLLWGKVIDYFTFTNSAEVPTHLIVTSDGGILLTIYEGSNSGYLILSKFDANGTLLWAYEYQGLDPLFVEEDNLNNLLVAGRTFSFGCQDDWDACLLKFDKNGIMKWGRTFGDSALPDEAYSVHQMKNGNYIVCSEVESFGPWYNSQTALACFDSTGTYQWMKLIKNDSTGSFPFNSIKNKNGSLTIAGIEGDYAGLANLTLIKTDTLLKTLCPEQTVNPIVTSFTIAPTSYSVISSFIGQTNFIRNDSICIVTSSDLCLTVGIDELPKSKSNSVYPNPFNDKTTLYLNESLQNGSITIFDMNGKKVKQIGPISGSVIPIKKDDLEPGIYFVRLAEDGNIKFTSKLLIVDN